MQRAAPGDRLLDQAGGHQQTQECAGLGRQHLHQRRRPRAGGNRHPLRAQLYESLLAESPKHAGLLLAAAQGFTEYAYAFVDARVDEAKEESLERADALRERARKLYLRANRYGMRGLEARYPGFDAAQTKSSTRRPYW